MQKSVRFNNMVFTIIECERSACFNLSFPFQFNFLYRTASFLCRTARGQTHEIYCLEPSRAGVSYIDYGNTETTVTEGIIADFKEKLHYELSL